jgi:hypothetical protein
VAQASGLRRIPAGPASPPVTHSAVEDTRPAVPFGEALFSRQAELKLLRVMQHDLNVRLARIIEESETESGEMSGENRVRLARAAEEQARIARLAERLAQAFANASRASKKE